MIGARNSPSRGGWLSSSRRAASRHSFCASFVRWRRTVQTMEMRIPSSARNETTITRMFGSFSTSARATTIAVSSTVPIAA